MKINFNDIERGTAFEVLKEGCTIMITSFEGKGAAGVVEHGYAHHLKKGDIIYWDHQSYLGSDPGPGIPWFTVKDVGRGGFWPNDWGCIDSEILRRIFSDETPKEIHEHEEVKSEPEKKFTDKQLQIINAIAETSKGDNTLIFQDRKLELLTLDEAVEKYMSLITKQAQLKSIPIDILKRFLRVKNAPIELFIKDNRPELNDFVMGLVDLRGIITHYLTEEYRELYRLNEIAFSDDWITVYPNNVFIFSCYW